MKQSTTPKPSPWMDTEEAAQYIGCQPGTLKTWRNRGDGPRFHTVSTKLIRYHIDDLDAFIREGHCGLNVGGNAHIASK